MKELISQLIAEYGQQAVIVVVGFLLRWWEKSKVKAFYRKRIEKLIGEVKEAKYGKTLE